MTAFHLHVENESDIQGLPQSTVASAAQKAQEKNIKGWLFGLEMPSYIPFMTYSFKTVI